MPRSITKSVVTDFEPRRKNPLTLLGDSNLDKDLKSLLIAGEPTGIELSKNRVKINTPLECDTIDGNIITSGDISMIDGNKVIFNLSI